MAAGRDWQLYGDEYGRMKFGNGHFETLSESKNQIAESPVSIRLLPVISQPFGIKMNKASPTDSPITI